MFEQALEIYLDELYEQYHVMFKESEQTPEYDLARVYEEIELILVEIARVTELLKEI